MSIECEVILKASATSKQLTAVGTGLWRWCIHTAPKTGINPFLESQALFDLIAGRFPTSGWTHRGGVRVCVPDEPSHDRRATIDSLRRELPAAGVEEVLVDGASWNLIDREGANTCAATRNHTQ